MLSEKQKTRNENLLERLTAFSEKLLRLSPKLPKTLGNLKILDQFIPSGTAVGALYCEACEAESWKDFLHKLKIAKKEAKETVYWLRLLLALRENEPYKDEVLELQKEAAEYILIFSSIISKSKK